MSDPEPNPLLASRWRGAHPEAWHRGAYCVLRNGVPVESAGAQDQPLFLRSAAKPFQAWAALSTGLHRSFPLSSEEIALACGSHGGERLHVETARRMLARAGLGQDALGCGPHEPLFAPASRELFCDGERPGALHDNCSGKHAAMLLSCVHRGESLGDYLDPGHPHQLRIRALIAEVAEVDSRSLTPAIDGCSAPTWALDLPAAARAWTRLLREANEESGGPAARVLSAMATAPFFVGGSSRFDTELSKRTSGRVIAKIGADGFYAALCRASGICVALHVDDGEWNASERILGGLLLRHGVLDEDDRTALSPWLGAERRNHAGLVIGSFRLEGALARI